MADDNPRPPPPSYYSHLVSIPGRFRDTDNLNFQAFDDIAAKHPGNETSFVATVAANEGFNFVLLPDSKKNVRVGHQALVLPATPTERVKVLTGSEKRVPPD